MGFLIVLLVLLMVCSAFASSSEVAFFSLSPNDVDSLEKSPARGARTARKLLDAPEYLLATILIVNNLVNICVVITANSIIDRLITFPGVTVEFLVKTVLLTFLLLLFGEIMPKLFTSVNALRITTFASIPLSFLKRLLKPFSWLLIRASEAVTRRLSMHREALSMDDISDAVEITSDQSAEEKRILSGIANFVNTEAAEIMRPRVDVVAVDTGEDFETVCATFRDSGFSRIPVYEESLDHVKGILYIKDLLPHLDTPDLAWQKLIREPYFVPDHKKINDLFTEFQARKIHIAIVVDEYGSTLGLVSLEDILEEIIGEIADESDADQSYYTRIDADTWIFEGKTHLIDFLKVTGLDDEYLDAFRGDSETLAGVMMEARRDFLKRGETIVLRALTLTVDALEGRRIAKIRVKINRTAADQTV